MKANKIEEDAKGGLCECVNLASCSVYSEKTTA